MVPCLTPAPPLEQNSGIV